MWLGTQLIGGILLLYLGAEWLVKGTAGLGLAFGIRPVVIGLTAVAYGTSMPEFVVSTIAAFDGMSAIAVGNVIGSNIANLGLIFGLTIVIRPLVSDGSLIRREVPLMLGCSVILPLILLDGLTSRVEGILLLGVALVFTFMTARTDLLRRKQITQIEADLEAVGAPAGNGKARLAAIAVVGLTLLVVGGNIFVSGASAVALAFGISQRVVGLTIAAIGTSTPELATSVVAALRGHSGIAIGNVIGSNIFNVLFVLGGAATIRPVQTPIRTFGMDLAVLVAISAFASFSLRKTRLVTRVEAGLLLTAYVIYIFVLITRN